MRSRLWSRGVLALPLVVAGVGGLALACASETSAAAPGASGIDGSLLDAAAEDGGDAALPPCGDGLIVTTPTRSFARSARASRWSWNRWTGASR